MVDCAANTVGTEALVSWTAAADDNAASYIIRRSRNGGDLFWNAKVIAPAATWTSNPLAAGSTYTYAIETVSASNARSTLVPCTGDVAL